MLNIYLEAGFYFIITLLFGFLWLKLARKAGIGEYCTLERFNDRTKGLFKKKEGTVTMGGIIILIGLWIFALLNPLKIYLIIAGIGSLLFIFGAFDDIAKIIGKNGRGNSLFTKIILHFIVGAVFCLVFYLTVAKSPSYLILNVIYFAYLVNAINITDGLDGLAIGNFIIALGFLIGAVIGALKGHPVFGGFLGTGGLTGLVTVFIYGTNARQQEREANKRKSQEPPSKNNE